MIRSIFKKTCSLLIAFSMLLSLSTVIAPTTVPDDISVVAAAQEPFERQKINFNREWKFIRENVTGAQAVDYDDNYWFNVGLPHDFSIPYWQETSYYTGYGWYRKTFNVEPGWIGNRIFLDFEGVFHTAEVWVNGREVDTHEGGYTGFEMDITDYVNAGDNLVAICVNNIWKADL